MTWGEITALLSFMGSAVAIYIAFRKAGHETLEIDASAAQKALSTASAAMDEVRKLRAEVTVLRRKLERRDEIIEAWQEGIEKLVRQIRGNGQEPVWVPEALDLEAEDGETPTQPRKGDR